MSTQVAHHTRGNRHLVPRLRQPREKKSNAIIDDLGDPEDEALFPSQATSLGRVSGQVLHPSVREPENNDSSSAVNLLEFPWAAGGLDHVDQITGRSTV